MQFFLGRNMTEVRNLLDLGLVEILLETAQHTIVCHLGCIRDVAKHRVIHIVVDSLQDRLGQLLAEFLALLIDVLVGTTAEIDALEGTSGITLLLHDALDAALTVFLNQEGGAWHQLLNFLSLQVEGGLEHRALTCQHHNLIILIIESRTDAPRVSHGEHLARTGDTANHITTIKVLHCGLEHIAHLHVVFDIVGDVEVFHLHRLGSHKVALHLSVEAVSHQLQHDVSIAVDARTLTFLGQLVENLIDIGHIEVAAKTEVLRLPVVAAQEWVNILDATLSGGTVSQVTHVKFASERQFLLGKLGVGKLLRSQVLEVGIRLAEDFGHGVLALGTLTEHILMSWLTAEFHTSHTSTLLSTVVLLLHHQIEFVECVHPSAVLLLVILQWLQQSDHCHATFMLQWFHLSIILILF